MPVCLMFKYCCSIYGSPSHAHFPRMHAGLAPDGSEELLEQLASTDPDDDSDDSDDD